MEEGIKLLDYENIDQMVQVHGMRLMLNAMHASTHLLVDYEGVGWSSRDANSKAAASEISTIFSNHYPEFLVRRPGHEFT